MKSLQTIQKTFPVSDVICTTLTIGSRTEYLPAFIEENIKSHFPESSFNELIYRSARTVCVR